MDDIKLLIDNFIVNEINVKLYTGSDYEFLNPPKTMDESNQKKRISANGP